MKKLFMRFLGGLLTLLPFPALATLTAPPPPVVSDSNNDEIALVLGLLIVGYALFSNGTGAARGKSEKKKIQKDEDQKTIVKF